jgi:dienelactone hydrolase
MIKEINQEWQPWLRAAPAVPRFQPPAHRSAWEVERSDVRAQLIRFLGQWPARPKVPAVKVLSREDCGDYVKEKFVIDNLAGTEVPGYLLLPTRAKGPVPAILYHHWHGDEYAIGKEEIFQNAHTPVAPGPWFVSQGYAVMAIDAACFGERNGLGPEKALTEGAAGEMSVAKFNLWMGRTLWGMIVRDDLMALDYLASRPEIDASRLGATGISMGSTRTWWMMALDERIKAGVGMACLTRYQDLLAAGALNAHGIYYFVPGMLQHFDTEAVVSLIAPRPMLFMTGDQDRGSPASGVRTIGEITQQVYHLYDADKDFQNILYPGVGHQCTPEMWNRMNQWMAKKL